MDDETKVFDEAVHEYCRNNEIKRLAGAATITRSGEIKIGDVRKFYTFTAPKCEGGEGEVFVRLEGIINVGGNTRQYSIQRFNRKGGWSESLIRIDGQLIANVKRGHEPRVFESTGHFQLDGQAHNFKLREVINPMDGDAVQLGPDEIQGLMMMLAS